MLRQENDFFKSNNLILLISMETRVPIAIFPECTKSVFQISLFSFC